MTPQDLIKDREALAALCRRHGIRRLALFGSVLRGDAGPDSDVDILVEFEPGRTPGLRFIAIQEELSTLLGRNVDLTTPGFLSPHFRDRVVREALSLYEAA
jgi:predicted nucleotidyltransferase